MSVLLYYLLPGDPNVDPKKSFGTAFLSLLGKGENTEYLNYKFFRQLLKIPLQPNPHFGHFLSLMFNNNYSIVNISTVTSSLTNKQADGVLTTRKGLF